jgi:hypothetical protein
VLVPGFKAAVKNGSTASELRRRCACAHHGSGHCDPTGYKVAARVPRAPTASSPRMRHPDHNQRAAVLGAVKARPRNDGACGQDRATADLDSPCARRPPTHVGRGEETGFQVEQRNWKEGSGECVKPVLDFESLIQGQALRAAPRGAVLDRRCARRPHPSCGSGRKNGSARGPNQRMSRNGRGNMPSDQIA